ncbi:hypothetical protein LBYS11_16270 [Lysinibacillus sp. YS11]|uniref:hypothetical protein n=1 Tax=Lysinibacillus sp. YS11 TaxID=2072025 RepID=UPI000CA223ED|nr:hypothetical protein [Lysinibacillus sp. YS11]AUS87794.1 hypothetical protein LBYS11_16270 [Lysinibacillus sp. YS11]
MTEEKHLEGLTLVQKRLVKAYATSVMGEVRTVAEVKPTELQHYVKLEIAEREIAVLVNE